MRYMLDTNICIYLIKQRLPQVLDRLQRHDVGDVVLSAITLSELEFGVAHSSNKERNRLALLQFLAPLDMAPYTAAAASHYGDLRAFLEEKGTIIGSLDMLIAAHALALNCVLVTNNEREFRRIPRLAVENWAVLV